MKRGSDQCAKAPSDSIVCVQRVLHTPVRAYQEWGMKKATTQTNTEEKNKKEKYRKIRFQICHFPFL